MATEPRAEVTHVIRGGIDVDGLGFGGDVLGRIHICTNGFRDDIYGPTDEGETDPVTGRVVTVFRFVGRGPWPWPRSRR